MDTTKTGPLSIEQLAEALAAAAYNAFSFSLGSNLDSSPNTNARRYFDWCTSVAPGQLVLETSTYGMTPAIRRLGILRSITEEPEPDWEDEKFNGPAPTRLVYTLECLDGELMRWDNCRFIAMQQNFEYLGT